MMLHHSSPVQTAASGISPPLHPHLHCVQTPKESRLARENKTTFPDSRFKYAICANLGNLTCRPEVTIHVSFAHHRDYCSFLREIGEEGLGHECCYNARQCKEWGLAIKGNALYFFEFLRWLTCFHGAVWSLQNGLKFRYNLESFQLQAHPSRDLIPVFHQT